jgi:type I restriction enzyme S subunit
MNTPTLVGESGYVSKDYPDLFLPDRLWQIRPAPEADGRWLSMVLSSPLFRRMIGRAATGTSGSMKNLSQDALLQLEVALPPPSEQRGIVAVLSAWDLAIELMDNLIALKRRVLLGLLQSLVEHADFPLRELGDFATPVKARINPAEANDAQDSVELDAIEGGTGRVLERTTLTTASGPRTRFRAGDVLFGKLRPYLNKFTLADDDGVCSTEIWALRPDQSLCTSDWLFALVQTQAFQAEANRPTGSRMPRAEWSVVAQAPLPLPEIEEQRRCVRPFIDCHRQVQILISRGELLRAQKHGLMQHLLTGNWRPLADGSRSAT